METTVVLVGRQDAERRLQRVGEVLRELMPGHSPTHELGMMLMPEVQGGCVWLRPPAPYTPLSTQFQNDRVYTVVYGDVLGCDVPAEHIAAVYERAGTAALRSLDGAYTAIVVDRRTARLHIRTDAVGVRSVHYAQVGDALIVSPQLLGIAATGLLKPQWDLTTVASIVGMDWSIGRRSLLRGVSISQPFETIDWTASGLNVTQSSPLDLRDRIDARDRKQIGQHCDRIVDQMTEVMRRFAGSHEPVRVNLTDGLDSRVVLALFIGAGARERLVAATSGVADSPDVIGAQRLAAMVSIPHHRREPSPVTSSEFLEHAALLSFLDSGDGSSKRALAPLPSYGAPPRAVSGNGGEIYRGNYYPVFGFRGAVPGHPRRFAETFLARLRAQRFRGFDDSQHAHRSAVTDRLEACIACFAGFGAEPADLADLFYLWERHGQWGASTLRRPWSRGWSPFASPSVIRLFYRLPAPLGMCNDVHARTIRRYLPLSAYLRPFNKSGRVVFQRIGTPFFLLRQFELAQRVFLKKLSLRLRRGVEMQQLEQVWARMLAGDVFETVHDLLSSPSSLPVTTFGPTTVANLLQLHRTSHRLLDTLAPMISVELTRLQVEQASQLAMTQEPRLMDLRP